METEVKRDILGQYSYDTVERFDMRTAYSGVTYRYRDPHLSGNYFSASDALLYQRADGKWRANPRLGPQGRSGGNDRPCRRRPGRTALLF
ncbi:MAG: hypothetical protein ACLRSW_09940 [Christensenellaceae bacterium]